MTEIETYDFQQPSGLSLEPSEQLNAWMGGFTNLFREKWAGIVPSQIEVQYETDSAYSFAVLKNRMPQPAIGFQIRFAEIGVDSLLILERSSAVSIVMEMTGDPLSESEDRPLSPVETSLFDMFVSELASSFSESWIDQKKLLLECVKRDDLPHRSRLFNPKTIMLNLKFDITQGGKSFSMYWAVPQTPFEQLLSESIQPVQRVENQFRERLEELAKEIKVNVAVQLGDCQLSFSQLSNLSPGDVIVLDRKITEPLPVRVEERTKFEAWPGRRGNVQAIKIRTEVE